VILGETQAHKITIKGPAGPVSSDVAELLAIREALSFVLKEFPCRRALVRSDSEYAVKTFGVWLGQWRQRGLRTACGKTPKNLDLILEIERLTVAIGKGIRPRAPDREAEWLETDGPPLNQSGSKAQAPVIFEHVRGHSGDRNNELADSLAKEGRMLARSCVEYVEG
jgi:ribonuclease HI